MSTSTTARCVPNGYVASGVSKSFSARQPALEALRARAPGRPRPRRAAPTGSPSRASRSRRGPRPGRPRCRPRRPRAGARRAARPFSSTSSVALLDRACRRPAASASPSCPCRARPSRCRTGSPRTSSSGTPSVPATSCAYAVSWPWPCEDVPAVHGDRAVLLDLAGAELGAEAGPLDVGAEPEPELHRRRRARAAPPARRAAPRSRRWPGTSPAPRGSRPSRSWRPSPSGAGTRVMKLLAPHLGRVHPELGREHVDRALDQRRRLRAARRRGRRRSASCW